MLGQCPSLAHLNSGGNSLGAEGAGVLAAELGQCPSLPYLNPGDNEIGAEGLAVGLGQCPSRAHLDVSNNSNLGGSIRRSAAGARRGQSLYIVDGGVSRVAGV